MAKDPAMLWYWSDWYSGTATLSRFLKGCYMDLLHAQFNSGHLTLEEIKTVLGSDFGQAWPTLQKKFTADDAGKYFNVRLDEEKEKRAAFTKSRRDNLHKTKHMKQHMGDHMENENEDRNDITVFGNKKEWSITVAKVFANEKPKLIYDLKLYFEKAGKVAEFDRAGFTQFDEFMKANPANHFKDDNHLYNSFRKFHVEGQLRKLSNGASKKLTFNEIDQ